jgi:3-methyladenine DNA glycosylase AlkD
VTRIPARASAEGIERALRAVGNPDRAEHEQAYLKSDLAFLGASVPATRRVALDWSRAHPDLPRRDVLALVRALWASRIHECRMAAVELLAARVADLGPGDVVLLERLLRESRTWALVDGIAARVVGPMLLTHPELGPALDRWSTDHDFWIRRAALLALLLPLRRDDGQWARFTRYADALLDDTEFFVRKAIGWILRDTARRDPNLVFEWLRPRARRASGVTYREAVKPLRPDQRAELVRLRS